MNEEYRELKREIMELKTAKPIPGNLQMYSGTMAIAVGRYNGVHKWRVYFEDVGDEETPIVGPSNYQFLPYNSTDDTIDIFRDFRNYNSKYTTQQSSTVIATRPINRIVQITTPQPLEEWTQVRDFYPQDMGTTPGWCLQNCRLGFHIYSGTYADAKHDMMAQAVGGTLHGFNPDYDSPPDYIAVPVYMDTGIEEGHVVVWDHGTIYSDGTIYPSFQSIPGFQAIWGWGELCDGTRVVQHV